VARTRNPARPTAPVPPPLDVRLMHAGAALLLGVALLAIAVGALRWATRSPQFTLGGVRIEGDVGRNSVATIRANAMPRLAGNFFSLDLAAAKQAFESVPWVRRAVVQRVWPNRLAVRLEEHRVAAWWHVDERDDLLVNVQGEVFEANPGDVEDEHLPVLAGPDGSSAALLAMLRRLQPVFDTLDARIERLSLSARGSWQAALDNGAEVELGRGSDDEVVERTRVFAGTVTQLVSRYQRPLEYADLRHAGGYALKLRGIGTVAPVAPTTRN
jgi:cell division protein FtsQ